MDGFREPGTRGDAVEMDEGDAAPRDAERGHAGSTT